VCVLLQRAPIELRFSALVAGGPLIRLITQHVECKTRCPIVTVCRVAA